MFRRWRPLLWGADLARGASVEDEAVAGGGDEVQGVVM